MYVRDVAKRTLALLLSVAVVACGDGAGPGGPPRTYWMGFSARLKWRGGGSADVSIPY